MSVASHLNIELPEYDARIRAFIPAYEEMLDAAAAALAALDRPHPAIVDLGIGTGALAARCLDRCPDGRIVGIDSDPEILELARRRFAERAAFVSLLHASFLDADMPPCDAVVASLALHHVATAERKGRLYRDLAARLRPRGLLIVADCMPASDPALAALGRDAWRAHLRRSCSEAEAEAYLETWAKEDVYFPLEEERSMMRRAGLHADVVWRSGGFAVVAARR